MGWPIKGAHGRLRSGSRVVAALGPWTATPSDDGSFQLSVEKADRDPVFWDNHDPSKLMAELHVATTDQRFRAQIASAEPLVVTLWRIDGET